MNMTTNGINFARDQLKDVDWNVNIKPNIKKQKE